MPRFPHKQRVFSPSPVLSRLIPSFSNTLSPYTLPVLVHGVQSMQNLKPAKEFRTLIANEESLDALMEIKGHLEYYLPEESGNDKRALAYLWRDVLWAIWGTASENGGSKVIKSAPKELRERYQEIFR